MYQRFNIGDGVKALGFTDCFNKWHDEVDGLTVETVTYMDWEYSPHWRIKATYPDGYQYIEGNQDHFVHSPRPAFQMSAEDYHNQETKDRNIGK